MPAKGVTRSRLRDQALVRALNEKLAAHRPSRMFIEFFCECDRGSCDESIPLAVDEFEALRRLPGHFAVLPGHCLARARRRDVLAVRRRRAGDGLIAARARGESPTRGVGNYGWPRRAAGRHCGRMAIATRIVRPQRPARRPASGPPPVTLDALGARWRLRVRRRRGRAPCVGGCGRSLRFPPGELAARGALLARERADTARVLDELAREEHVHLMHRLSAPRATRRMLGLPAGIQALVLALDGVLTASADLHAAAWQETFEELLARRAGRPGERFAPSNSYDPRTDYREHLHGRPRLEGVRTFLASRGITLPEGTAADPPDAETVHGLANRKNLALRRRLDRDSVAAFEGSRRYLEDAREAGLGIAVVSSSSNTDEILERSGLAELVDVCIDGDTMRELGLRPRPAPDTFVAACELLGVAPADAAGFVTSSAGIAGLRAAGFGSAVGVSRDGVKAEGADRVVFDLAELLDPVLRD